MIIIIKSGMLEEGKAPPGPYTEKEERGGRRGKVSEEVLA